MSVDCSAGLACSTETAGGYYGSCQPAVYLDAGTRDLAVDMAVSPDLASVQDLSIPPG